LLRLLSLFAAISSLKGITAQRDAVVLSRCVNRDGWESLLRRADAGSVRRLDAVRNILPAADDHSNPRLRHFAAVAGDLGDRLPGKREFLGLELSRVDAEVGN